jgi:hypothetical protein
MPSKKLNFSLSPVNDNPTSVSGGSFINGFTHKNGFPTIKFSIPAQNVMLDTKNLYLCGQLVVLDSVGGLVSLPAANRDNYDENQNFTAVGGKAANQAYNFSNWNGVSSAIDKVVIQSKKTQQELQTIINYSSFNAMKMGHTNNNRDYLQAPLMRSLCSGITNGYTARHIVNNPVIVESNLPDIGNKYYGQFFSIKLDVALLQSQNLLLSNNAAGGLLITLHLSSDSAFFHSFYRNIDNTNLDAMDCNGCSFMLKNVKLEGKYLVPTPQDLQTYNTSVVMNSRVNLMNDLVSSENANTFTPQLQMVKGIVNTFLDDDQANNYRRNQNNFRVPVGIEEYQQGRNNIRYPYDFPTQIQPNTESSIENQGASVGVRGTNTSLPCKINLQGDSELRLQFARSITGGIIPSHTSATLKLTEECLTEDYGADTAASANVGTGRNIHPDLLGIGCDYANNVGQVQNFVNQDYELKVRSGVNTGRSSLPIGRKDKIEVQESYLRNFSTIDLKTLQKVM